MVNCKIIPVDIYGRVTAISEDVIEEAKKQFIEKFEATNL